MTFQSEGKQRVLASPLNDFPLPTVLIYEMSHNHQASYTCNWPCKPKLLLKIQWTENEAPNTGFRV